MQLYSTDVCHIDEKINPYTFMTLTPEAMTHPLLRSQFPSHLYRSEKWFVSCHPGGQRAPENEPGVLPQLSIVCYYRGATASPWLPHENQSTGFWQEPAVWMRARGSSQRPPLADGVPGAAHSEMPVRWTQNEEGWNEPLLLRLVLQHPGAPTAAPTGMTPKALAALNLGRFKLFVVKTTCCGFNSDPCPATVNWPFFCNFQ